MHAGLDLLRLILPLSCVFLASFFSTNIKAQCVSCFDECVNLNVGGDVFDSEISWELVDATGSVYYSGGAPYNADLCIPADCYYSINMFDSFGDGWGTGTWTFSDATTGEVYSSGTLGNGSVGTAEVSIGLNGCTDSLASNYDSTAQCDDGSCAYCDPNTVPVSLMMFDAFGDGWNGALYQIIDANGVPLYSGGLLTGLFGSDTFCLTGGCYDISVGGGSWDSEITWTLSGVDGGSISGVAPQDVSFGVNGAAGCTDPAAENYDPLAQCDDGSCVDCFSDDPTGCPEIELGDDIVISQCPDPCENLTLDADYFETGETSEYEVCAIPYSPPYAFNAGTPILVTVDDIWSEEISLPFNFCFFGNVYDKIVVGANAVITFDLTLANAWCEWAFSQSIPNPAGEPYRNSINGPYHDIDPSVGGNIRYAILGSYPCRTFVVNYESVPHFSCNEITSTSQIVLYETTNVIEVYIDEKPTCFAWNDGNAVIGVQNDTGTVGFTPESRQTGPWAASNEAWRFTPSGNSIVDISWYTQDDGYIGSGASINICPDQATESFIAEADYTACDGSIVTVSDIVNVSCTQIMLPVEWLDFTARLENDDKHVRCAWQTASEMNNEYFDVERSSDGLDWERIGEIPAGGNPNFVQSYEFIDNDPLLGYGYYRIRQNDSNGEFDFSETRVVERLVTEISVFPNPGNGTFRILGYSGQSVAIHDTRGRVVGFDLSPEGEVVLNDCSAGTYLVKIGSEDVGNPKHFRLIVE